MNPEQVELFKDSAGNFKGILSFCRLVHKQMVDIDKNLKMIDRRLTAVEMALGLQTNGK